jgi:lipopolysaccharide/colanic/teichoic acid biosynthesis glycosyltransferase
MSFYRRRAKPIADVAVALVAMALLAPLMLVLAIAVRLHFGSPVFFRQVRAGLDGRPFTLFKFRTMNTRTDDTGALLPDAQRLTPFGRFLRRCSLDELPELVNVVRGEMSLIGPRPLPVQYLDRYSPRQARRHEVRPGITGLAQVCGRNGLPWAERFEHDVWYVDHESALLDLRILIATVAVVLAGSGVSQAGHATMEEFVNPER